MSKQALSASQQLIDCLQAHLRRGPKTQRYIVAYSGGADSTALLHALHQLAETATWTVAAIHIHHGLQQQADQWADHVQQTCTRWQIPLHLERIAVIPDGQGIEAAARDARYTFLANYLQANDVALTAHHADDQAETLLLHLLRGSGLRGLAGIPPLRKLGAGLLYRPLLDMPGVLAKTYCHEQKLKYIEDGSNTDERFDRNWLRHSLLPMLHTRFPKASDNLAISAQLLRQSFDIHQQYITQLLTTVLDGQSLLNIDQMQQYPIPVQHELLRTYLTNQQVPAPPRRRLSEFLRQLKQTQAGRSPVLAWQKHQLRCYQGHIHYLLEQAVSVPIKAQWQPPHPCSWGLKGTLSIQCLSNTQPVQWPIFTLHKRAGGESIKLVDGHHHSVKKLYQQASIPPWERASLPLVYHRQQLVAIGDKWLHPALQRWLQKSKLHWHWQPQKQALI